MDNPLANPAEFQAWKEHPTTQAYHQFLKDRVSQLSLLWAQGHQLGIKEQSQAETMGDLASLSVNDVRGFYSMEAIDEQQRD